jgi:ABC-2 type transport system ATP-binding protein
LISRTPIIHVENLSKRYGATEALHGLELDIFQGEIFGILGPNGAGKTTLIRILSTLTKPTSGTVLVDGHDVMKRPVEAKRRIGVVHQTLNIDPELSAEESMRIHGMLFGLTRRTIKEKTDALLELVGLTDRRGELMENLSGGLKRRLTIARAMMHDPRVLIMDEPTVGLDAHARRTLWDLIRGLKRRGSTILLTTHYIEEAEQMADRVAIVDRGALVEGRGETPLLGKPEELIRAVGRYALDIQGDDKSTTRFFERQEEAAAHLARLGEKAVVRPSTLEDVFVHVTGNRARFDNGGETCDR